MNFQITQGTGTTIATDTGGGGENYQKIKLIDGTPGSVTPVGTSGNPLQISLEFTGLNSIPIAVDGSGVVQPISGTVNAVQSGTWNINNISGIISLPTGAATESTLSGIKTDTDKLTFVASRLLVDGSGVTQPISGTVTANAGTGTFLVDGSAHTQPVSGTITSNIGTTGGLALNATLTNGSQQSQIVDGSGNVATVVALASSLSGTELGLVTNSLIYGKTTGGGGGYVEVKVTPSGSLSADVSGSSVSISNFPATQAVTQSTSPWVVSGTVTANAGSGTFNNQQSNIQLDYDTGVGTQNLTVWGIALPASGGSVAGGTVTNPIRIDPTGTTIQPISGTVAATQSGSWTVSLTSESIEIGTVDQGTPNTIANAWPVKPTDGTNSQSFTASGEAKVNVTQPLPAGTNVIGHVITDSGSTTVVTGTVTISGTVTANAGTNLNTSALALDTSVTGLHFSQGSTTSGQKGPLIQGAVTTSAPSYITAQTSPLSLTTSGLLRVDGSGVTQPVITNDSTTAISLTAVAQTSQQAMQGHSSIAFTITSVGTGGQFVVEGSVDGSTWFQLDVWSEALESWVTGTITATGTWWAEPVGALEYVRIRVTALTSGTIIGTWLASTSVMGTFEFQGSSGTNIPPNIALVGGKTNDATPQFKEIPLTTTGGAVISTLGNSTGKTVVMKEGTLVTTATTADQVILTYTVTSGKTFYVEYFGLYGSLTTPANTAAVVGTISLETPSGTKVYSTRFTNSSVGTFQNAEQQFAEPLPISSGTVIRIVTTPGVTTSITWLGNFGGYEI